MKNTKIETGIFKNEKGRYDVRVATHINGKYIKYHKRNLPTVGEARRVKRLFDDRLAEQRNRIRNGVVTWELARIEYFEDAERRLAASTIYTQRHCLNAHTSVWNDVFIDEIPGIEIEGHVSTILVEHSADSKNNLIKYIRNVFRKQVHKGVIKSNPANGISFGNKKRRKRLEAMTHGEIKFLFFKAKEVGHKWFPIWFVTYMLGLRPMEGFVLLWTDIDFENRYVHITKTWCSKTKSVKEEPKDGDARIAPMSKKLPRQ